MKLGNEKLCRWMTIRGGISRRDSGDSDGDATMRKVLGGKGVGGGGYAKGCAEGEGGDDVVN